MSRARRGNQAAAGVVRMCELPMGQAEVDSGEVVQEGGLLL